MPAQAIKNVFANPPKTAAVFKQRIRAAIKDPSHVSVAEMTAGLAGLDLMRPGFLGAGVWSSTFKMITQPINTQTKFNALGDRKNAVLRDVFAAMSKGLNRNSTWGFNPQSNAAGFKLTKKALTHPTEAAVLKAAKKMGLSDMAAKMGGGVFYQAESTLMRKAQSAQVLALKGPDGKVIGAQVTAVFSPVNGAPATGAPEAYWARVDAAGELLASHYALIPE